MSKLNAEMGWGERLAIAEHFKLDDRTITSVMGVTQDELSTARDLAAAGTISMAADVNFGEYEHELDGVVTPEQESTATSVTKPASATTTPVTATKPVRTPKKRGRKGDKIKNAFLVIPATPVNAETFITEHGISMNVLRQSKRFDKSGETGTIHVRKDRDTGVLMVWRDDPTA